MFERILKTALSRLQEGERGFVLPMVLFGLMLMSTVAIASLLTSEDEAHSARAMRESSTSFYAAEAGLNQIYANWATYQDSVDALAGGDSLDLGWTTLNSQMSYRAVVHRWDNGDQPMYQLVVEGRGSSSRSGQRMLSFMLTSAPGSGSGSGYSLGDCCDGAMKIKGRFDLASRAPAGAPAWDGEIVISGFDEHPPAWAGQGVCSETLYDKPAVIMEDLALQVEPLPLISSSCNAHPGNVCPITVEGAPSGYVEDPTIADPDFDNFGGLSFDSLKALADHEIGVWGTQVKMDGGDIYPRLNGDGTCNTSHPYNWGSDDPNHACFNYFPIILVRGEIEFKRGYSPGAPRAYGQGMLIMDWNYSTNFGTELELGREGEYNGIILGRGCLEIQKGPMIRGAFYVNGDWNGDDCDASGGNGQYVECRGHDSSSGGRCDHTEVHFSQCAVDRVLSTNEDKFGDFVEIQTPASAGGASLLVSRSFGEFQM